MAQAQALGELLEVCVAEVQVVGEVVGLLLRAPLALKRPDLVAQCEADGVVLPLAHTDWDGDAAVLGHMDAEKLGVLLPHAHGLGDAVLEPVLLALAATVLLPLASGLTDAEVDPVTLMVGRRVGVMLAGCDCVEHTLALRELVEDCVTEKQGVGEALGLLLLALLPLMLTDAIVVGEAEGVVLPLAHTEREGDNVPLAQVDAEVLGVLLAQARGVGVPVMEPLLLALTATVLLPLPPGLTDTEADTVALVVGTGTQNPTAALHTCAALHRGRAQRAVQAAPAALTLGHHCEAAPPHPAGTATLPTLPMVPLVKVKAEEGRHTACEMPWQASCGRDHCRPRAHSVAARGPA